MSKKNKTFAKARVFKAPVEVGRDNVVITLPKSVIDYINISGEEIFWAPVNGVIQICGTQPHMVIPMMSIDDGSFMPQEETRDRVVEAEE